MKLRTDSSSSALGQVGDAINMMFGMLMIGLMLYVAYMMAASGWDYVNKTSMAIAAVITVIHCASVFAIRRDAFTVKGIWVAAFGYFGMLTYFGIVHVMLDASPEPTTAIAKAFPALLGMLATASPVVVALVGVTVSWLNDLDSSSGGRNGAGKQNVSSFREANSSVAITASFQPDSRRDQFESELSSLKARRGSSVNIDFSQDRSGQYRNARTRDAFHQYTSAPAHQRNSEDFMLSLMVGYATDSPILGYAVGGSLLGGFVGASLADHTSPNLSDSALSSPTSSWLDSDVQPSVPASSSDYTPVVESCRASDYSSSSSSSDSSSSYSSSSSSYESSSDSSSYDSGSSSSSSSSSFD